MPSGMPRQSHDLGLCLAGRTASVLLLAPGTHNTMAYLRVTRCMLFLPARALDGDVQELTVDCFPTYVIVMYLDPSCSLLI